MEAGVGSGSAGTTVLGRYMLRISLLSMTLFLVSARIWAIFSVYSIFLTSR